MDQNAISNRLPENGCGGYTLSYYFAIHYQFLSGC